MLKIYGDIRSGNCYKLKLALEYLQREYQWIELDILAGVCRTPEFLATNPNGKVPLAEVERGEYLAESNAILYFIANGTPLLPEQALQRARVLAWQNFEQYSHEPNIAVARFIRKFLGLPERRRLEYQSKQEGGHRALQVMEQHLQQRKFFVGEQFTIADISLYAYTHVADEGGFDLERYPAIQTWLQRVAALPGHTAMT